MPFSTWTRNSYTIVTSLSESKPIGAGLWSRGDSVASSNRHSVPFQCCDGPTPNSLHGALGS